MSQQNPILQGKPRTHRGPAFSAEEVRLANRNHGIHLEALRYDVTPIGMHYLLSHFDVPLVTEPDAWTLSLEGLWRHPASLTLAALRRFPPLCQRVVLECAGNGRALVSPRWQSQPWSCEAVGQAEWIGCRLSDLLNAHPLDDTATTVVFSGADQGVDGGVVHFFERSLTMKQIKNTEVMLAWAMNGQPLLPQHGFPLRLVVPGWFGMASVKWLCKITATAHPFMGYQQTQTYLYKTGTEDTGTPITFMKVKSLMVPPGIPDWYSRRRLVRVGNHELSGRAWSGNAVPIERVEVSVAGRWHSADLVQDSGRYAWTGWRCAVELTEGRQLLYCRATDAEGNKQPFEAVWDRSGMGNNGVQQVEVWGVPEF